VSLLTDALRLKEGRRPSRGGTGPSLPPFRGPNRGYWVGGILVLVFSIVVGLACWKGAWALEKLEELAGFQPLLPAKVAKESNSLDLAKETVSPPVVAEGVKVEGTKGMDEIEKPIAAKIPAKGENLLQSVSLNPPLVPMGEQKKRDEDLLVKGVEKKVEEKARTTKAVMEEKKPAVIDEKKPMLAVEAERVVAEVPMGGLKPMKVELDEAGLVLEKPEEREKKRVDGVEAFLRSLQVQGVRLQGKDSRIMVDGVPIGVGEKVGSMGLVLESVEPQKLIFSDSGGKKYPKSY
jgi:hypothetical protein